jgi:hypothetical protein
MRICTRNAYFVQNAHDFPMIRDCEVFAGRVLRIENVTAVKIEVACAARRHPNAFAGIVALLFFPVPTALIVSKVKAAPEESVAVDRIYRAGSETEYPRYFRPIQ